MTATHSSTPHALVVGAGFGGLAAAIRLRARGYRVSIVEALDRPGGRGRPRHKDGFTFDAGPTVITAPYLLEELFSLFGERLEDRIKLLPVDPYYRVLFNDGGSFDYVGEEERILNQIREINPRDVDGYLKFADHARRIFEIGYDQLADVPFDRIKVMMGAAGNMIKLQNYRTVWGLVSKYIKDPNLRQVFSFQPLLLGGSPFRSSSIYLLIHWLERKWGVWFAEGGTGALVNALWDFIGEIGVERHLNAPVEALLMKDGRTSGVRLEDGRELAADIVVANADPSMVYKNWVPKSARKKNTDGRVGRVVQSMGLFVSYFGTDKPFEDVAHHTIVLGPRYKGLLHDIFAKKHLANDFSLYLHRPVSTDPTMAPPGKDAFYVLSPTPNLNGDANWDEIHDEYHQMILDHLDERVMPGLNASIETKFAIDPRHFKDTLRSMDGAAFGPEPLLRQSAYFRYHNISPDVGGLYFVGAGTHPGAGVPGVLSSARVLDRLLPQVGETPSVTRSSPSIGKVA